MVQICEGTKTKNDMLTEGIEQYKDMFIRARGEFNKVVTVSLEDIRIYNQTERGIVSFQSVRKYIEGNGELGGPGGGGGGGGGGGRGARGGGRGRGAPRGAAPPRGRGGRGGGGGSRAAPPPPPDDFDEDMDPPPPPPAPRSRSRQTAPASHPHSNSNTVVEVKCQCDIPAAERTVTKQSKSQGKQFWTCGNNGACDFFEWKDGLSSGPIASGSGQVPAVVPAKRTYTDRSVSTFTRMDIEYGDTEVATFAEIRHKA